MPLESSDMRALVVQRPGGPQVMRLRQLPAPQPGPDRVVVAVEAVGVNPVDAGNRADPSWAGVHPPYVMGYEVPGRIHAVGDGGSSPAAARARSCCAWPGDRPDVLPAAPGWRG